MTYLIELEAYMTAQPSTQQVLVSRNPATREVLARTACTALDEIPAIVTRCRQAALAWRSKSLPERLSYISSFRKLLCDRRDELGKLITSEAGKPFAEAVVSEVFSIMETCRWLEEKAACILEDEPVELNQVFFTGKKAYNVFQPLGVIAVISPWNYPFSIPAASMLLALVAGNGVVLKPSPRTPLIAAALLELFEASGFPPGLVGLVQGDRLEGEKLILSGVDRVVFTGSVAGGKAIMAIAAQKLIPLTLELGGKHPAIVLPDADPAAASSGIVWSAFTNAGQACASIDRLILVNPVEEKILPLLVEKASKLRLGDPIMFDTDVGPLIDEVQLKRINDLLGDALQKGARILCGGRVREDLGGYYFEPTVLVDVNESMRVLKEEIFGPLLPVIIAGSRSAALAIANDSELGLAASVWTGNLAGGEALARELNAGLVWLNDGLFSHICPDAPWGGVKYSGFGRAHSKYELLDMVCIKNIGVTAQGMRDWHFPYSQASCDYIKAGIDLLHGNRICEKLAALVRVIALKSKLRKK
jgi:acyl-CoA reductase-like NAD-dependent aldehyde dehydrogenase